MAFQKVPEQVNWPDLMEPTETSGVVRLKSLLDFSYRNLARLVNNIAGSLVTIPIPPASGGTGTSTVFTQGSIVFAGAAGVYTQDNARLFWDDTNFKFKLGGDFSTTHVAVTLGNGNNVDIAVGGASLVTISGPTGGFSVNGFVAAGTEDGKWLTIINETGQVMTIANEDTVNEATAANRITTCTGANVVTVAGPVTASFIYDQTTSRWKLEGTSPPVAAAPSDFVAAGASHAHGLVIDPGATAPLTSQGDQIMMNSATWVNMGFAMWTRRFYVSTSSPGSATALGVGGAAMTTNAMSSSVQDATGDYGFASTGTINTTIGWTNPASTTAFFGITSPRFVGIIKSGATSPTDKNNVRVWVGLFNTTPAGTDTIPSNSFGFRYSTAAGDTNWMACNQGGGSPGAVSTGVAFAVDTRYVLEAWYDNTNSHIHFYINGVQTNDISSSLPVNTTAMNPYCLARNLATETKNFKISKFVVDFS